MPQEKSHETENQRRKATRFYPPSPAEIPPLVAVTGTYRLRVVLVLLSLILFLGIYLALLVGSGYLVCLSFDMPTPKGRGVLLKLATMVGSPMLFLFLLKGIFKRNRMETENLIEVHEADQPRFFKFVRRLCREADSPIPGKIYLTYDVNAAVTYPHSLLYLFWPVRKNLVVGLGLVNCLNLSEFKAVLAHEFGHFAQSSMKLGQFVYVANRIICDMVYGRDFWDDLILKWRRIDIRLSFPAWVLSFLVWILRQFLGLIFYLINLVNLSLSRQMEYSADLQSVRLSGSDALISGLWKTERGSLAFQLATADLASLSEHSVYSDDLFRHHSEALDQLDETLRQDKEARRQLSYLIRPYRPGKELHFPVSASDHAAPMWQTHPSNRDREWNVKRTYVRHPMDKRPAWCLFRAGDSLRTVLTLKAYKELGGLALRRGDLSAAEEVHRKSQEEKAEMRQADHYHGLYDDRHVEPGDVKVLAQGVQNELAAGSLDVAGLRVEASRWTGPRLEEAVATFNRLREEMDLLFALKTGVIAPRGESFEFRGKQARLDALDALVEEVGREQDASTKALAEADRAFFRYFYYLSGESEQGSPEKRQEFMERYEFLLAVQGMINTLNKVESHTVPVLELLQQDNELSENDFKCVRETLFEGWKELERVVLQCASLSLPKLSHLDKERTVKSFVLPAWLVAPEEENTISGKWLQQYLEQFQQVLGRLRKLHYKNLGVLLKLQEQLDSSLFCPETEPTESVPVALVEA